MFVAANSPILIGLPDASTVEIDGSQPATSVAASVDAYQVSDIEQFWLWRMTNNSNFAGTVQNARGRVSQRKPAASNESQRRVCSSCA